MSKRLIAVLALALVVGLTFTAYAEVQNVKVSGDLNILGVARNQFDLARGIKGNKNDDSESYFATQTRIRIDADLTDNVGVTMRLINERNWNQESVSNTDIDLDLAYVTLKEFLYSPLSLTLGRQELKYGNQLVLGNAGSSFGSSALGGLSSDLSERKAFDGIKATLNYDPLVIDAFYAKIDSNSARGNENDDIDLYGIYATYDINKKLSADVYGLYENSSTLDKNDKIYTVGTLIKASPIADLKLSLEAAMQLGNKRNNSDSTDEQSNDKRSAYAMQAMADYTFSKVKMTPMIGAGYTYLSGDKDAGNNDTGKHGWDQMFYNQSLNNIAYAILPFTNLSVLNLRGSIKPMDDVTVALNYGWYNRAEKNASSIISPSVDGDGYISSNPSYYGTKYLMNDKRDLGNEVDLTVTYDYTEDVQLGLTGGWFAPGKAFSEANRRDATQLIGSMKVTF
jgi:hypothetical protein